MPIFPARNYVLEVNKPEILSQFYYQNLSNVEIPETLNIKFSSQFLTRSNLILLDILTTNDWKRPIYFASTVGSSEFLGLDDYLQLTGNAYKLTPIKAKKTQEYTTGSVNIKVLYNNLMQNFDWVPVTSPTKASNKGDMLLAANSVSSFGRLASDLIDQEDSAKAEKVLKKCFSLYPKEILPYNYQTLSLAESYY